MQTLIQIFAGVLTILIFIPYLVFAFVYYYQMWRARARKHALTVAVNITTFFLITAIWMMYRLVHPDQVWTPLWLILPFFLVTALAIGWLQYKVKGAVNVPKLARAVWRLAFVFFSITYVVYFVRSLHYFLQLT